MTFGPTIPVDFEIAGHDPPRAIKLFSPRQENERL